MNWRIFPPEDIVYVDESGVTEYYSRDYGLALRGEKVYGEVSGKRYKRLNIVSAQCGNKKIATHTYDWATNSTWFEVWFEWHLGPLLSPGKVIIMDNALFHRKKPLEKIAAYYGLRILWLPPYSPDFNSIEHLWANLKNWLKSFASSFNSIQDAVKHYFILG
jgi:transposase